jgi:predicted enzyme related to lactoylglutathione lyase
MNRLVHFEIHAKDQNKIQQFYSDVFGWTFQDLGPQMGDYRLIITGPDTAPGINGGMNPRRGESPAEGAPVNAFVCTMEVDNIDDTLAKIEKAGGTVATEKMEIPGIGWLAYRKDPDGNIFGVMENIKK